MLRLHYCIQVKAMRLNVMFVGLTLALCACASAKTDSEQARAECVQRTSDGPWVHVGKQMPSEEVISRQFAAGGEEALYTLLGDPFKASSGNTTWIYESRRESLHVWCDPPAHERKYDQAFTILRVVRQGTKTLCKIEGKEFISDSILSAESAIKRADSPLGFDPRQCGSAVASP